MSSGRSLGLVIEEALRQALACRTDDGQPRAGPPDLGGDGLQPGVDLDDAAMLLDLLEERLLPLP